MEKVKLAYIMMVDLLDASGGEMTLGQAAEIAADVHDLTLGQEAELVRLYSREHAS